MLQFVLNLCRRPAIQAGPPRDRRSRFRDPRLASFLAESNRPQTCTGAFGNAMPGRRILWFTVRLALVAGASWVVLESTRALLVF